MHVIECDVRMTKDGQIMVAHDMNYDRIFKTETCTEGMKTVRLTDFDKLPEFKDEIPVDFSYPKTYYTRKETDSKTYTRLEDVFKEIPRDIVIHIDIKDGDIETPVHKVVDLVKEYHRQKTTILGAFKHSNHLLINVLDPEIPTWCDPK